MTCEYPNCTEHTYLVECKATYDTTIIYCHKHAPIKGYCVSCGFKLPLTISNQCAPCHKFQREALNYWMEAK